MGIGIFCELSGVKEESDLVPGLDFRLHEYRREVFLRFYEFHLKYIVMVIIIIFFLILRL